MPHPAREERAYHDTDSCSGIINVHALLLSIKDGDLGVSRNSRYVLCRSVRLRNCRHDEVSGTA